MFFPVEEVLKVDKNCSMASLNFFSDSLKSLLDACPHICLLLDENLNVIDCNKKVFEDFSFKDIDDLKKNFWTFVMSSIPEYLPNGRKTISPVDFCYSVLKGQNNTASIDTHLIINNELRIFNISLKRISFGDKSFVVCYGTEMSELQQTRVKLEKREKLLIAISEVANLFMSSEMNNDEEFEEMCRHTLAIIANSVEAHCISIWENFSDDNSDIWAKRLYGWNSDHEQDYENGFLKFKYVEVLPEWLEDNNLSIINTCPDFLSESIKKVDNVGICDSVILIPLKMQNVFWGFVGIAHKGKAYFFDETEKQILLSAAMINVSGIARYNLLKSSNAEKENALRASRSKTEFLARISHEIRTPINAIMGMNLLARKCNDIDDIQYNLDKIEQASQQLLAIINDVLDMSKIEEDKLEVNFSEFNFSQILEKVVNTVQVKMNEKGQIFLLDIIKSFTRNVIGDQLRIAQVLSNILNNASKFTPDGGKIVLKIRQEDIDEFKSNIKIDISDTGIGIAPEAIGKIFDAFEQADGSIIREFGGTGLGLSICRKLIKLMGGDISVVSEVGKGSTFSFNFIITWGSETSYFAQTQKIKQKTNILIIDDSNFMLKYLKNLLTSYKLSCDIATCGKDAVLMAENAKKNGHSYNVIFCDWYMPGMSGKETILELKKIVDEKCNIIVITAEEWGKIRKDVTSVGIKNHLNKPILPSVLYNKLIELIDTEDMDNSSASEMTDNWLGKNILIVDDNEMNRVIISGILGETGVTFDYAVNGVEAVSAFKNASDKYDLIIMDVQMPILDGLSATKQIRLLDCPRATIVPIVAMTANAFNEDRAACLKSGMNEYIAKPVDVAKLQSVLKKFLG
ncbi:MAG: response regulator [Oscillospiraceae bacterium]|jgi:signal transduction histidine kinase/CheY-like chemotaxis protein|nr:response regulator [Oscillospiraceae bacterium]